MNFRPARELALLSLFVLTSCSTQNSPTNSPATETVVSTTPPFQTKEPDRYRATRTITTYNSTGGTSVSKSSIARAGGMRRQEFETGGVKVVYLDLTDGRFVLLLEDRVFADLSAEASTSLNADDQTPELSPERLLHAEGSTTSYQKLGPEIIGGRKTNKYRIVVNAPHSENVTLNETMIWIDEDLQMPTKSETKSTDGTRVTMELSDITLEVDGRMFQIPDDCEKVTFTELRKRLRKTP